MATPYAYNPSRIQISGTTQSGDFAVGTPITGFTDSPQFWNGPDESVGYIIARPVPSGNQPNPLGIPAYLGFFRSDGFSDQAFFNLVCSISGLSFPSLLAAYSWLYDNGYSTNYVPVTPTPTPSVTPTLTQTPTNTNTPTPSITASQTQTPTPSITASQTQTPTPTNTVTPTLTRTPTPTPSITASQTQTPTLTRTPTPTTPSSLVVHFDISNSSSYPGSGSVITDLSGAGNNATLTGDYSYSSSNSGIIVMGGTNSLASITQNATINISSTSTPVSVVIWARVAVGYTSNDGIWTKQGGGSLGYDGYRLNVATSNSLVFGFNGSAQNINQPSGNNVFTAGTWAMFSTVIQTGTSDVYVNGNSTPVITVSTNDSFPNQANLQIGQSIIGDGAFIPMSWGQFRYYKGKALSTAEILALFNADKQSMDYNNI